MDKNMPRGIRNNNPGNIRKSAQRWVGKVAGDDAAFETFDKPENGIRALAVILLNYQRKHNLRSVVTIINRWAPPSENKTGAYVADVARALRVGPADTIDLTDSAMLGALVVVIIYHENGRQPYAEEVIKSGVRAALAGVAA